MSEGTPVVPGSDPEPTPDPTPAPEPVNVEERFNALGQQIEALTAAMQQRADADAGRGQPPTTGPTSSDQGAQAESLVREIQQLAQTDPNVRAMLVIAEGLHAKHQADLHKMRVDSAIDKLPEDEQEGTRKLYETGDFRTVEAARRAFWGEQRNTDPKPKPKVPAERDEATRSRESDVSVRGISAADLARKRMTNKDYVSKIGNPNLPMEERIKLRREREKQEQSRSR